MERPGLTRLLVSASDAGGARNVAPVAVLARQRGWDVRILGSAATVPLFGEYGLAAAEDGAVSDLSGPPGRLLCGTARPGSLETRLTRAGRAQGWSSVAVLDEWYGIRTRFLDGDGSLVLPDLVCCPDQAAAEAARAEGLDERLLRATGSPALAATADRVAALAASPPPVPDIWARHSGRRLLFLSETHALDYGDGPGQSGPLGPWLGYSETGVREDVAAACAGAGGGWCVIEKLHPAQRDFPPPPRAAGPGWFQVAREPLWPLLWHAEAVVGMRTMALLEAAMMGHTGLAYQPNLQGPNQCAAVRMGLAATGATLADLSAWLRIPRRRGACVRPACADSSAAARILDLIDGHGASGVRN